MTATWRRWLPRALVVALVVSAAALWWWRTERTGVRFAARFTSAVGIYAGSDVKVLGVPVGTVDAVTPQPGYVQVSMHVDAGVRLAADSQAVIVAPNLVSDRFVQIVGDRVHGAAMRSGAVIPLSRTRSSVELDDLYRSVIALTTALGPSGANATGSLTRLVQTGAANLGGNGAQLNRLLTALSGVSAALGDPHNSVATTVDQLSQFTAMLATNDGKLGTVDRQLASVSTTLAADRQSLGSTLRELGTALGEVQAFIRDNRAALSSNIASLSRVAASLARRRSSLLLALRSAPQLIQNFLAAYDPARGLVRGRIDLNELSVWSSQTGADTAGPPLLLPATNVATGAGR